MNCASWCPIDFQNSKVSTTNNWFPNLLTWWESVWFQIFLQFRPPCDLGEDPWSIDSTGFTDHCPWIEVSPLQMVCFDQLHDTLERPWKIWRFRSGLLTCELCNFGILCFSNFNIFERLRAALPSSGYFDQQQFSSSSGFAFHYAQIQFEMWQNRQQRETFALSSLHFRLWILPRRRDVRCTVQFNIHYKFNFLEFLQPLVLKTVWTLRIRQDRWHVKHKFLSAYCALSVWGM